MKKINRKDLKEVQLGILKFIDSICKKNDLKYFINYGTLIGAVRHNGFIPWDDDVDICLLREDYDKLIIAIEKENNKKYKVLSYDNTEWYFHNFAVVVDDTTIIPDIYKKRKQNTNVFVDIFPIDRFDDKKILKKIAAYNFLRSIVQTRRKYIYSNNSKLKNFIKIVIWYTLYFVNPRFFTKKIANIIEKNYDNKGKYQGFIGFGEDKEVFYSGIFDEIINLEFENYMFPAPKNYDEILNKYYGNYMELPPEEERVFPHNINAYFK